MICHGLCHANIKIFVCTKGCGYLCNGCYICSICLHYVYKTATSEFLCIRHSLIIEYPILCRSCLNFNIVELHDLDKQSRYSIICDPNKAKTNYITEPENIDFGHNIYFMGGCIKETRPQPYSYNSNEYGIRINTCFLITIITKCMYSRAEMKYYNETQHYARIMDLKERRN